MALTMSDLHIVRLVADVDTPNQYVQFNGVLVFVDPSLVQPLAVRTTPDGLMYGIRGYARIGTDGTTEWVMTDVLDTNTRLAIRHIPSRLNWVNGPAHKDYNDIAGQLIIAGIPPATVVSYLSTLYSGAAVDSGGTP